MGESIVGTAGTEIAKAGILGAAVVALAFCIYILWKDSRKTQKEFLDQLISLQDQRVKDAIAVRDQLRDQLLGVIKECTNAITTATKAMEAQRKPPNSSNGPSPCSMNQGEQGDDHEARPGHEDL